MNWEQLQTILWLRWRLLRNQWARHGAVSAAIAVIASFGALVLGGICFIGALVGAALGLGDAKPEVIMGIWFGVTVVFLIVWLVGLLAELQRSETIDLQKLLHLPVALGQLFVVNYVVSHFAVSIILAVPLMVGLAIGLAVARGPAMLLMVPLALGMVFMVTAWTYCLRGWLATIMSNPRRRRTVIMCISMGFILLAQGPNLYFNVFQRHHFNGSMSREGVHQRGGNEAVPETAVTYLGAVQGFVPPFWVPIGAQGLAEQRVLPALFGILGCLGLGALGLRRAYRSTLKFYRGETGGKVRATRPLPVAAAKAPRAHAKAGVRFLEWRVPGVPEQSAALALATFRSLLRAPEVKMALAGSVISMLVVVGMIFLRQPPQLPDTAKPFMASGVVMFSVFMLIQFFSNQFGFDRDGFRALILSPASRRLVLFGKNLAILPVGFGFGLVLLTLVSIWLHLPALAVVAALLQLVTLLLIASLGGNLLSILMPFRIQPGTMKPTKMPALAMLVMILCQMLLPTAMAPVLAGPFLEWCWRRAELPAFVPINVICSALLCAGMAVIYWQTLTPLGRLLQKRETKILSIVTVEVE